MSDTEDHFSEHQPPAWATRFLHWYCNPELWEEVEGDLQEAFQDRIATQGIIQAKFYYAWDVLRFYRTFTRESRKIYYPKAHSIDMLFTYLKVSSRYLWKHKSFLLINLLGLAISIAACLLILQYITFELDYDSFHTKSDRIYRVSTTLKSADSEDLLAPTIDGLAPTLKENYPDIEAAVRFIPTMATIQDKTGAPFNENYIFKADPEVFQVFDYLMLAGDPATALKSPQSVVLNETLVKKYFGSTPYETLIGQSLTINQKSYQLTGIIQDLPENSDLQFDGLLSWQFKPEDWLEVDSYTFLLFRDTQAAQQFEKKLADFDNKQVNPRVQQEWADVDIQLTHHLQPLTSLHYTDNLLGDTEHKGNKMYVYIFSLIALFILIIACINYVNFSIAQASRRNIEVGIRKTIGARRFQLWLQYMGESLIITLAGGLLAILLVVLAGQYFGEVMGEKITLTSLLQSASLYTVLGIILLISLLAGSYPAFFLSSFQPVKALKGANLLNMQKGTLRKSLLVIQFTVAVSMVIGTCVVRSQVYYLKNKDLGFRQEKVVSFTIPDDDQARQKMPALRHALMEHKQVRQVAFGSRPDALWSLSALSVKVRGETKKMSVSGLNVDENYVDLLDMKLVQGHNFLPTHKDDQIIVNEAFVKEVGWDDPVGQEVSFSDTDIKTVAGVVKDFHYATLHKKIEPLILFYHPDPQVTALVGLAPKDLDILRTTWQSILPGYPLDFEFLDDAFQRKYQTEIRMLTLFNAFSGLSIFIACLGLLGLISFVVRQRTKEIGIRKVLGAGKVEIVSLVSKEFILILLIACVIAMPLAYEALDWWLQTFAYRVPISASLFIISAFAILLLAVITLSYHALKATRQNPVDSLRYE